MSGPSYHGRTHLPGTDDHIRLGLFALVIYTKTQPVVAGDDVGPPHFIPPDLDGSRLRRVEAYTKTAGTGVTVQVRNITNGDVDMLTTPCTINTGEKTSLTAATPAVIDETNNLLAAGDEIAVDVDVGSGSGLVVKLGYW